MNEITIEDTGLALEAIAAKAYGANWDLVDAGAKAKAKQEILELLLPGLNVILAQCNQALTRASEALLDEYRDEHPEFGGGA